jgi:hypothetical protein
MSVKKTISLVIIKKALSEEISEDFWRRNAELLNVKRGAHPVILQPNFFCDKRNKI